jgi:hypothetical protein
VLKYAEFGIIPSFTVSPISFSALLLAGREPPRHNTLTFTLWQLINIIEDTATCGQFYAEAAEHVAIIGFYYFPLV